jgi:hypothetical protein
MMARAAILTERGRIETAHRVAPIDGGSVPESPCAQDHGEVSGSEAAVLEMSAHLCALATSDRIRGTHGHDLSRHPACRRPCAVGLDRLRGWN